MSKKPDQSPGWKEVDRLISEQKFEEASSAAEKLRLAAQKAGNQDEWTRALIKEVQLRIGLHGYETAVRFLKEQPWPEGSLNRSALNLFYAQSLVTYYRGYSWEVNRREKVESKSIVDLKAWTKDQIFAEAQKAYEEVWRQRVALGKEPITRLGEYLDRNTYPAGIRDTLRDAVSYLYVELLADTSMWRPEESNELYRLDLKSLITGNTGAQQKDAMLLDQSIHPMLKICYILSDLEIWHAEGGKRQAALEARLERLRRLHASFAEAGDRKLIREDLEKRLPQYRDVAWWAAAKAAQAEFIQAQDDPQKLVWARTAAQEGYKAYPDSIGGKRCYSIFKTIEAPQFTLASMSTDGLNRRSVEVTHKNLSALYFRAYSFDIERRLETARDYNLLPNGRELEAIIKTQRPVAEWQVNLPETPDYQLHRTFVTPPMESPGFYLVAGSAKRDFSPSEGNAIQCVNLMAGGMVLISSREADSNLEVRTLSGETGKPLAGVDVALYRYDWQNHHQKVDGRASDANGMVRFSYSPEFNGAAFFLFAKKGAQIALDSNYLRFYQYRQPDVTTASLIYTDRSIYRPLQKIYWKVLGYEGRWDSGQFRALPSSPVTITLLDPNSEKVDSQVVTTDEFGCAAGEFTAPAGRLLGGWRIQSSISGQAYIRVEEYKRPTFEATFKDPDSPMRLNRPTTLTGDVKYYFGLPVVNGTVKWRITREPVYPWWWGWYHWGGSTSDQAQIVATGSTGLKEDGTFQISFTPEADERKAAESKDVTYLYRVAADVTDEGGETRTATKTFRLGFVSVEAHMDSDAGFFMENVAGILNVLREDLNGNPRAGKGEWRLVVLKQPEITVPPADLPLLRPAGKSGRELEYKTAGDLLRPRWNPGYSYEAVLRSWSDGSEKGHGTLAHDAAGKASLKLPGLPAGAYRLYYETVDDFGASFKTSKDFVVAGPKMSLALPEILLAEKSSVQVGGKARFLALSGLQNQPLSFEVWRNGRLAERRSLLAGMDNALIEIPIGEQDRGGFGIRLTALRDYQFMNMEIPCFVPWDNKELKVEFSTFRDKMRPGTRENWRVTVKSPSGTNVEAGAAEILAYMYDRSLDIFAPHNPANPLSLYPHRTGIGGLNLNLGQANAQFIVNRLFTPPGYPSLEPDRLKFYEGYGVGGPGVRRAKGIMAGGVVGGVMRAEMAAPMAAPAPAAQMNGATQVMAPDEFKARSDASAKPAEAAPATEAAVTLRSEFAETAFWQPRLLTGADGSAAIEFIVPDSVTSWNVWVHAVTRDLQAGSLHKEARSVKELMVRPYVPRFLREGDKAELKVVVNNASERELKGRVTLDILDPDANKSILQSFGLGADQATRQFTVGAGGGSNLTFSITTPVKAGLAAFKVTAVSGDISDGELRPVPVLPGRMHLSQSRFITLKNKDRREMTFEDLKKGGDPTLISDQMVVTLDAQLFYSVLSAVPYLINFPYECTEQTLNRFLSTGILSGLFKDYPAVARMAQEFSKRETPLESWDSADPNRKMALIETPWLIEARGGQDAGFGVTNVLDPRIAKADRDSSIAKLRKAQTASGGFPWWPGGPPSPYMTLYIMYGFAKASEFGVDVPRDMVQRGWAYLASHFREEYAKKMVKEDCCWEFLTFLNYVASCYPDPSWMGEALTAQERKDILNHCFKHWTQHSPYLKCELALTLKRMGRPKDATLIFASVMDSAKTTQDQGTFWAPEDRAWLWYNDTIETQAFALRTLMELTPEDARKDGLVQWLFLNKKLNHWKSTRATAEVVYSLVHYLKKEGALGIREDATVRVANQTIHYDFEPDQYTGKKNQTVIPGDKVNAGTATIVVEKESKGLVFASATWGFSTEKLPEEGRGDFLSVSRSYFKRENTGREFVLKPLAEGAVLQPGDEVEVHLSIQSKHPCEYIHLRDPRAAGLEPENAVSRYKWDLGISWYEETRDSGADFFFEWLPQGEYAFKYRLRANMGGTFKVGPATLQSMYAPEFSAYSAGATLNIR